MGAWGLSGEAQRHPPACPTFHSAGAPIRLLTTSLNSSSLPGPRHPVGHAAPRAQAWGFAEATSSQPVGTRTWLGVGTPSQL